MKVCSQAAKNCSLERETQYRIQYKEECGRRYKKVTYFFLLFHHSYISGVSRWTLPSQNWPRLLSGEPLLTIIRKGRPRLGQVQLVHVYLRSYQGNIHLLLNWLLHLLRGCNFVLTGRGNYATVSKIVQNWPRLVLRGTLLTIRIVGPEVLSREHLFIRF